MCENRPCRAPSPKTRPRLERPRPPRRSREKQDTMTPDMQLALPARAENIAIVRHAFGALGDAYALDAQVLSDIRLAVTEACTNVVVHAYPDGGEGPMEVCATLRGDELRVVVRDEGRGHRPTPRQPRPRSRPAADRLAHRERRAGTRRGGAHGGAHDVLVDSTPPPRRRRGAATRSPARPDAARRARERVRELGVAAPGQRPAGGAGAVQGRVDGARAGRLPDGPHRGRMSVCDTLSAHAPARAENSHSRSR